MLLCVFADGLTQTGNATAGTLQNCVLQQLVTVQHVRLVARQVCCCCLLCRLELTVDQSWPPTVLASLGQLERLKSLSVLKLDCGRQQPAEEMWDGEEGAAWATFPCAWLKYFAHVCTCC